MTDESSEPRHEQSAVDDLLSAVRARLEPLINEGARVSALGSPDAVATDIVARLGLVKNPWADIVGPCYTSGALQKELGVGRAALSKAVRERRALRLDTSDRRTLYPAFQVRNRSLVPGLADVLTVLGSRMDDPWTWAHWLNTPPSAESGRDRLRPIDRLADGDHSGVIAAARLVAGSWAS